MQRLFSMFPTAGPGIGLLLLRLAVAAPLVVGDGRAELASWLPVGLAAGLAAGIATPVLALLVVATEVAKAIGADTADAATAPAILSAAALTLLGPGAYAVDARLYGRRRVVTPHDPRG